MNGVSAAVRKLIQGTPFGEVYPPRPRPKQALDDGRTAALRILKRYISELTFRRRGMKFGPPIPFKVRADNIHIEWPDYEVINEYPSIVFKQINQGDYEAIGLTAYTQEETRDKFGYGTVVQQQSEYVEEFALEIHASLKPERRALVKGLEEALVPTEQMYGIRFRMPDYYDQTVRFTLNGRMLEETPDSAKHRRVATLKIEMSYVVASLVRYETLKPTVAVVVDIDESTGTEVVLDGEDPNTQQVPT